jgi:hypothetical protein
MSPWVLSLLKVFTFLQTDATLALALPFIPQSISSVLANSKCTEPTGKKTARVTFHCTEAGNIDWGRGE